MVQAFGKQQTDRKERIGVLTQPQDSHSGIIETLGTIYDHGTPAEHFALRLTHEEATDFANQLLQRVNKTLDADTANLCEECEHEEAMRGYDVCGPCSEADPTLV